MSEVITTELLGEHPALHKIATDEQLSTSWIRGNEGFIGFGEWRSASVKGPNRFADARKWWHEQLNSLKIVNEVHGIGTGPILFTSFSFDQDEESRLVIPKIVIGQRGNKSWITWIGNHPEVREANERKNPIVVRTAYSEYEAGEADHVNPVYDNPKPPLVKLPSITKLVPLRPGGMDGERRPN